MSETLTRIESFPFDSKADGYDADGYPVYDRAVGASMFRRVLAHMFSDGVLGDGASDWQISAADSGLGVVVQPGTAVIAGGIGATLDTTALDFGEAPAGNVTYSIMLRFDANSDMRSVYLVVDKGDASSTPTPKEPDTTLANIVEYRLGYAYVPSGAADMTGATIVNEKGLAVCPYAAPFDTLDVSEILADTKRDATTAYNSFMAYLSDNIDFLDAAIDDTVAGQLQAAINALSVYARGNVTDTQFNKYLDGDEDTTATDEDFTRLHHMKAYNAKVLELIQEPLAKVQESVDALEAKVLVEAPASLAGLTVADLAKYSEDAAANPGKYAHLCRPDWTIDVTLDGIGTVPFYVAGVGHDTKADGKGKAGFTLMAAKLSGTHRMNASNVTTDGWNGSEMRTYCNGDLYNALPAEVRDVLVPVRKGYLPSQSNSAIPSYTEDKVFIPSVPEIWGGPDFNPAQQGYYHSGEGEQYLIFTLGATRIKTLFSSTSAQYYWTRSVSSSSNFWNCITDGRRYYSSASSAYGVCPCFCI